MFVLFAIAVKYSSRINLTRDSAMLYGLSLLANLAPRFDIYHALMSVPKYSRLLRVLKRIVRRIDESIICQNTVLMPSSTYILELW